MASTLVDLVKITAKNTGTGAITLGSAVEGYRGIEALTNAQVYSYAIQQNGAWEVGRGTYLASGTQLSRSVLYSSNGGTPINMQPGAQISFVVLAEDLGVVSLAAQVQTSSDAVASALATVLAAQTDVAAKQTATTASANLAASSAGALSVLNSVPSALPYEVTNITGGIGTGTGGTNGTYAGGVSGGPVGFMWTYTIAAGALSSYTVVNPGIAATNTAPTLSLPAGGLTGATVPTATVGTIPVGRTFWAPTSDGKQELLWQNATGALTAVNDPTAVQYARYLKNGVDAAIAAISSNGTGFVNKSSLAQFGTDARTVVLSFRDTASKALLTGFSDGTLSFKMDWTTLAGLDITARIAAAGFSTVSGLAQVSGGTALGSPIPSAFAQVQRGSANRFAYGVGSDGTFLIGKYDTNLALAVTWANSPAGSPEAYPTYIEESGGQIYAFAGVNATALTSEGNNTNVKRLPTKIGFLSDRFRGLKQPYTMAYDGTNQRTIQPLRTYDMFVVTGQSNAIGQGTTRVDATARAPTTALMLTGGPVRTYTNVMSGSAVLVPLVEGGDVGTETIATKFALAELNKQTTYEANIKIVMAGSGQGGQPYSVWGPPGSGIYPDVLAQIARTATFGTTAVRGVFIIAGEADSANASYDANLLTYQQTIEVDAITRTGQKHPVILFTDQVGLFGSTVISPQKVLAAANANPKIVCVYPQYIHTYQSDNIHLTANDHDVKAEYYAKAVQKVIYEGREWRGVAPKAFTLGSNYVDVQYYVPVGPLVLDTALCTDPGNYGYTYSDASGRTISSVALKGGTTDTIRITLSGAIGTTAVLAYAVNNGTTVNTSGHVTGPRGCLRDSDPALAVFDGTTHLYNPGLVFQQALN